MSMPAALVPVEPAEPLAPWFGGKRWLAARIIERIEAIPHRCYAEPFVDLGGVFLRRARKPQSEIINDRNGEIVNLFRTVREHPAELARQFEWTLASRHEFRRLLSLPPDALTDIQRAAHFAYLQRLSFGGKPATTVSPGQMGPSVTRPARLSAARMRRLIAAAHKRLEGVHIENLDWAAFIARFDRPATLFYLDPPYLDPPYLDPPYLDPPYLGHEDDYGKGLFSRADFAGMAELLSGLKGRFILSLDDRPEARALFKGFEMEAVETRYTSNIKSTRRAGELLISGPPK